MKKRYLVTGANAFIGMNIAAELTRLGHEVTAYDGTLTNVSPEAAFDAVFHTETLHRGDADAIREINQYMTERLLKSLMTHQSMAGVPIVLISSQRAGDSTPYGQSKQYAELMLLDFCAKLGSQPYILRLAGEFGKWAQPNYNSVVATFCYNIARNKPITINEPKAPIVLHYIDDIVSAAVNAATERPACRYVDVEPVYNTTVGELAKKLESFAAESKTLDIPISCDDFTKKLYSTYLSYLPTDGFAYPLTTHGDERGSFAELMHFGGKGQVSVNISRPDVTKGNHWHHTKVEKFIVVSGVGVIRFRKITDDNVISYPVCGDNPQVVQIPPGYTHSITNTGDTDMITLIWANEVYDPNSPDTYFEKVIKED